MPNKANLQNVKIGILEFFYALVVKLKKKNIFKEFIRNWLITTNRSFGNFILYFKNKKQHLQKIYI